MAKSNTVLNRKTIDLINIREHSTESTPKLSTNHTAALLEPIDNSLEKERAIAYHFKKIMEVLELNLNDDSLKETPNRVAKMYVREMFSGLNPLNKPAITLFENKFNYKQMLVEKDISFCSNCEHHFVPFTGKAHVAYISEGKVIGLSKLNRIVQYYAHKPQLQERLTVEIAEELKQVLCTKNVAVIIEAQHHCVMARGIKDATSKTVTAEYCGLFMNAEYKNELHFHLKQ